MKIESVLDFGRFKKEARPIAMLTAYDAGMARLAAQSSVDCLLVGDSVAMVLHGFDTTLHATVEMMELHTAAVRRGAPKTFIVADMPFLSFRKGREFAADVAGRLLKAGAQAVKLEEVEGHEDVVAHLVGSGIPVMGHLGLTPQLVNQLGGFKVQGRTQEGRKLLIERAQKLQDLGAFALVLECVPDQLAREITANLKIPTIGIGAGPGTDGQVLVMPDMLGVNLSFKPKFLRRFEELETKITAAFESYATAVHEGTFPAAGESYGD